jgi:hypothetical protein
MHGSAKVTVAAGEGDFNVRVLPDRAVWTLSAVTGYPPFCPAVVALVLVSTELITSGAAAGRIVPPLRTAVEVLNKCGVEVWDMNDSCW